MAHIERNTHTRMYSNYDNDNLYSNLRLARKHEIHRFRHFHYEIWWKNILSPFNWSVWGHPSIGVWPRRKWMTFRPVNSIGFVSTEKYFYLFFNTFEPIVDGNLDRSVEVCLFTNPLKAKIDVTTAMDMPRFFFAVVDCRTPSNVRRKWSKKSTLVQWMFYRTK